MDAVHWAKNK